MRALRKACAAWVSRGLRTLPLLAALAVADTVGAAPAVPVAPQRIVSLLPSATEAVCALGACERLVGVDVFSQDPASVRALPQLGRTFQPDIEGIVRLKPDLVLMAPLTPLADKLRALGLHVQVVDVRTLAQVQQMLQQLDAVLGTHRADAVWQSLQTQLDAVARSLPATPAAPQVYLEVDAALYAAGPASFMGELLARLGAGNVLPASAAPFPRVTPEWVLRADPDWVIQTHGATLHALAQRPGWSRLRALQQGQVCTLSPAESRVVTRPGPRLATAAQVLARCLRGQRTPLPAAVLEWNDETQP